MIARRQIGEMFQMLRPERTVHGVFFGEPFAKINELTTMRTERPESILKPSTPLLTRRTSDL
jgi:hypothetical protein